MKYKLVTGVNGDELNEQVNQFLDEGWELYGYHKIVQGGPRGWILNQAMIKKDEVVE